jgi:uncharacterized membrane protein YeiH
VVTPVSQVYVEAPIAVNVDEFPTQIIELLDVAVTVLNGGTVIDIVVVDEQPFVVPVTEYTCVALGVAVTTAPVAELKSVAGDHE